MTGFVCSDAGVHGRIYGPPACSTARRRCMRWTWGMSSGERIVRDPRVISMEGTNLRTAPEELIPEPVDIIVADVSFIS